MTQQEETNAAGHESNAKPYEAPLLVTYGLLKTLTTAGTGMPGEGTMQGMMML